MALAYSQHCKQINNTIMTEITRQTVTLINLRDGQERYTRYSLGDVVEMIRKGKLKRAH